MSSIRKIALVIGMSLIVLVGCSSKNKDGTIIKVSNPNKAEYSMEYGIEDNDIKPNKIKPIKYGINQRIPLLTSENKLLGFIKLISVQKVNVSDWSSKSAANGGIDYSYAITFEADLEKSIASHKTLVLYSDISLNTKKGVKIGGKGFVGWGGFQDTIEVFENDSDCYTELILQPYKLKGQDEISIKFFNNSIECKPIKIDVSVLEGVKSVGGIRGYKDPISIESINGAKYSLQPTHVSLNLNSIKNKDYWMYDLDYYLKFNKAPSKDRVVTGFVTYNGKASINWQPLVGLQSVSESIIYSGNTDAKRVKYSDSSTEDYYTDTYEYLEVGDHYKVTVNKISGSSFPENNGYVRVYFEFPEEIKSRSAEEMLKFNGRFIVYQLKLKDLDLKTRKESSK